MSGSARTVRSVGSVTSQRTRTRCCSVTSVIEDSTSTVLDCLRFQEEGGTVATVPPVRVVAPSAQLGMMMRTRISSGFLRLRLTARLVRLESSMRILREEFN